MDTERQADKAEEEEEEDIYKLDTAGESKGCGVLYLWWLFRLQFNPASPLHWKRKLLVNLIVAISAAVNIGIEFYQLSGAFAGLSLSGLGILVIVVVPLNIYNLRKLIVRKKTPTFNMIIYCNASEYTSSVCLLGGSIYKIQAGTRSGPARVINVIQFVVSAFVMCLLVLGTAKRYTQKHAIKGLCAGCMFAFALVADLVLVLIAILSVSGGLASKHGNASGILFMVLSSLLFMWLLFMLAMQRFCVNCFYCFCFCFKQSEGDGLKPHQRQVAEKPVNMETMRRSSSSKSLAKANVNSSTPAAGDGAPHATAIDNL